MAAIHRSVSNQRFVTDRKVADCLGGELIKFQFFLLELGKEVMAEIVTEVRHDRSCLSKRFPENWDMSAPFFGLNFLSGPCRDRTDDPRIKSPLLYRLS